jgi:hypothetical protein
VTELLCVCSKYEERSPSLGGSQTRKSKILSFDLPVCADEDQLSLYGLAKEYNFLYSSFWPIVVHDRRGATIVKGLGTRTHIQFGIVQNYANDRSIRRGMDV